MEVFSFEEALDAIPDLLDTLSMGMKHLFVAIDGLSGTGKSRLATELAARRDAAVIHMDDFYLPLAERTPERTAEPGWNVDYERFTREVARPFLDGQPVVYVRFDCKTQRIGESVTVPDKPIYLIEGSYATHHAIPDFYDLRIVVCADEKTRKSRILTRDGEAMLARFEKEWFPLEEAYLKAEMTTELADVIVDTGEIPTVESEEFSGFGGFEMPFPNP